MGSCADEAVPWDILPTFDVMGPLQGEEDAGMRLIYLRGHLTLLKNSQSTEAKFLDWHHFRDYRAFEQFQAPDPSIGESTPATRVSLRFKWLKVGRGGRILVLHLRQLGNQLPRRGGSGADAVQRRAHHHLFL